MLIDGVLYFYINARYSTGMLEYTVLSCWLFSVVHIFVIVVVALLAWPRNPMDVFLIETFLVGSLIVRLSFAGLARGARGYF